MFSFLQYRSAAIAFLCFALSLSVLEAYGRSDGSLILQSRSEYRESPVAREPMIVEHPNGTLFVAGYGGGHPTLWSSIDRGAHWRRVNVGTDADGAIGNSDVDLAVAPDGTIYFINMSFDIKKIEGIMITVGVSRDAGASWQVNLLFDWRGPLTQPEHGHGW